MRYELKHDKLAAQIFLRASAAAKARRRAAEVYVLYAEKKRLLTVEELEDLLPFLAVLTPPQDLQDLMNRSREHLYAKAAEEKEHLEAELKEKQRLLEQAEKQRKRATVFAVAGLILTAIALMSAFMAWNQTRMANVNAKVAVDALLKVAKDAVYHLEYEEALNSILAAAKLEQNKTKVAQALQEIAFVYLESGQKRMEATDLISRIGSLLGNTKPRERNRSIAQMRQSLKSLDANHYNELMGRYFPVMLSVSGGTFQMGCDSTIDENCQEEEILHPVQVSSFELSRTETTFWQWGLYCAANRLALKDYSPDWGIDGDNPVVNVDWYVACAYANWLSSRFGRSAAYEIDSVGKMDHSEWEVTLVTTSNGFRLPTEAEWEYAARGGPKRQPMIYSGSDTLDIVAWYDDNSNINGIKRTHPVAGKKKNQLGLYDMSGNVYEWCWDWSDEYDLDMRINPRGSDTGVSRVLRGGFWYFAAGFCRVAYRSYSYPVSERDGYGFRLARNF